MSANSTVAWRRSPGGGVASFGAAAGSAAPPRRRRPDRSAPSRAAAGRIAGRRARAPCRSPGRTSPRAGCRGCSAGRSMRHSRRHYGRARAVKPCVGGPIRMSSSVATCAKPQRRRAGSGAPTLHGAIGIDTTRPPSSLTKSVPVLRSSTIALGICRQAVGDDGRCRARRTEAQHQPRAAEERPDRSVLQHQKTCAPAIRQRQHADGCRQATDERGVCAGHRIHQFHRRSAGRERRAAEQGQQELVAERHDTGRHCLHERPADDAEERIRDVLEADERLDRAGRAGRMRHGTPAVPVTSSASPIATSWKGLERATLSGRLASGTAGSSESRRPVRPSPEAPAGFDSVTFWPAASACGSPAANASSSVVASTSALKCTASTELKIGDDGPARIRHVGAAQRLALRGRCRGCRHRRRPSPARRGCAAQADSGRSAGIADIVDGGGQAVEQRAAAAVLVDDRDPSGQRRRTAGLRDQQPADGIRAMPSGRRRSVATWVHCAAACVTAGAVIASRLNEAAARSRRVSSLMSDPSRGRGDGPARRDAIRERAAVPSFSTRSGNTGCDRDGSSRARLHSLPGYQLASRSGVAPMRWIDRSAPLNSSSCVSRRPTAGAARRRRRSRRRAPRRCPPGAEQLRAEAHAAQAAERPGAEDAAGDAAPGAAQAVQRPDAEHVVDLPAVLRQVNIKTKIAPATPPTTSAPIGCITSEPAHTATSPASGPL